MTLDPGRVQAVFLAVQSQAAPADRAAVLDRLCAADDELRRRVEVLLIAHDRPDGLLDRPLVLLDEQVAALAPRSAGTADRTKPAANDPENRP